MKHTFCLLIFVFILIISGCSSANVCNPQKEFTSAVIVKSQMFMPEDFTFEAQVQRTSDGELDIIITSPKEISGLAYSYSDKFYMSYNELYCETEADYLPEFSFAQVIRNVLEDLYTNAQCTDKEADGCTYKGSSDSGEYTVKTDKEGYITDISVEEINFYCEFINNR